MTNYFKAKPLSLSWLIFSILVLGCAEKKTEPTSFSNQNLAEKYLLSYSPKYISAKDGLVLKFNSQYAPNMEGKEVKGISLSPKVDGTWQWINNSTLTFQPNDILDYGTRYQVKIDLNTLLENLELEEEPLEWVFRTRRLHLDIRLEGFKINPLNSGVEEVTYLGAIKSSDYIPEQTIEKVLVVLQEGAAKAVHWNHRSNGKVHSFEVKNIIQKAGKSSALQFQWDGKTLDPDFKGSEEIVVNAKDEFVLNDIRVGEGRERIVTLTFSRPLAKEQNFKGLIAIDDSYEGFKWQVENNVMYLYPQGIEEDFVVSVSDNIKSIDQQPLGKSTQSKLRFNLLDPAIKILGNGSIIPNSAHAIFSFEALNLRAFDLEIYKVFSDNILQFLQENSLRTDYSLQQVGREVHRERVVLSNKLADEVQKNKWTRIGLDLKDYIMIDPGAIYQLRIGFREAYAITDCSKDSANVDLTLLDSYDGSLMNYSDAYYNDYENANNPCNSAYYHPGRFIKRNVICSDIGVIVKHGRTDNYNFALSKISTGNPISGAQIQLFDYQQQLLIEAFSGANGLADITSDKKAAFATIKFDDQFAYIKLDDQQSNSLSDFDISGRSYKDIDGFLYADRGVHRPGDTIHLNFMLEDRTNALPTNHPIALKLKDPQGNTKFTRTTFTNTSGVFAFHIPTDVQALTGQWHATASVGPNSFSKSLRIETIKPNRLKIEISDLSTELNYSDPNQRKLDISSRWLHGAPADNLEARINARLDNLKPLKDNSGFSFMDPAREGSNGIIRLYEGKLDASGSAEAPLELDAEMFPGKVRAHLNTRVFEAGGNFSENYASIDISPFSHYVGVKCPQSRWSENWVNLGEKNQFQIKTTDANGQSIGKRKLTVYFYDIKWRWWYYESERYNIYRLNAAEGKNAFNTKNIITSADGTFTLEADFQDASGGRKLIRVCDDASGHCTGDFFYASGWGYGESVVDDEQRKSLSKLNFSSDQATYNAGDEVSLTIPSERGAKILVSIENGNSVIKQDWIEGTENQTTYAFIAPKQMTPNVYAHVMMLQSYDTKNNDLPIRMYGVLPIKITDPETLLEPIIEANESIEPDSEFKIEVSEKNGNPMTYTIAIVDEGLLDLTNFKTPDPHNHFYAKQALGVKTWDMYEDILTGINGQVDRMITVGGDGESEDSGGSKKALRFKPVVLTAGPIELKAQEKKTMTFKMPNYIGSVKVMLVGREKSAFGQQSATISVKKPIMVLPTLPRVISPGERISIPVSVFAMDDNIKSAQVIIQSSDNIQINGSQQQEISFDQPGEKLIYYDALVGSELGKAEVVISGRSGRHKIEQKVSIDIRNPNPVESKIYDKVLEANQDWSIPLELVGMTGTNQGYVELSTFPQLNLENRLNYLIQYPYGCVEQTTSGAFPQLYLEDILDLSLERKQEIDKNLNAAIRRLRKMQQSNGGFSYWPGASYTSHWGSTYAGHFLWEAQSKGYHIPPGMLDNWKTFQSKAAKVWKLDRSIKQYRQRSQMLDQAYRIYTLAIVGEPELAAMNVLRNEDDIPETAQFLLAAAYAEAGKKEIASELIRNTKTDVEPYTELAFTFGSDLRDNALIAQTLLQLDQSEQAAILIKKIAQRLNSSTYLSTQTLAQSLIAVGKFLNNWKNEPMKATLAIGTENPATIEQDRPVFLRSFDPDNMQNLNTRIANKSGEVLFVRVTMLGQKSPEEALTKEAINRNINLEIRYEDLNGQSLDPKQIERGTDFIAHVSVINQNSRGDHLDEMALSQIFPSGWEIQSGGLNNVGSALKDDSYDYRDVRDDRVYTFFDLDKRKDFRILLTATYGGNYILPAITCEAMYDRDIFAKTNAQKVEVVNP